MVVAVWELRGKSETSEKTQSVVNGGDRFHYAWYSLLGNTPHLLPAILVYSG